MPIYEFWYLYIWLRILDAYRSGQGRIVVRGKTDVELLDSKTKRSAVIIKEVIYFGLLLVPVECLFSNFQDLSNVFPLKQIPYQTNKASLVEKIAELVEDKVLSEKNVI